MKAIFRYIHQYFRKLDKQLIIAVLAVSAFGVVLLYSMSCADIIDISYVNTQIKGIILGFGAAMILSSLDYHMYAKLWFLYVPITLGMVLLTFTSLGYQPPGTDDRAWIDLGFMTIQPSEFLKLAFILSFGFHLSKVEENMNSIVNVGLLCLHGVIPVALIAKQGDDGTAIVFVFIFAAMLFAAGISWKYILAAVIAAPAVCWYAWNYLMQDHHRARFEVLFSEDPDPTIFYHQKVGLIALGSGQLFGKGLFGGDYSYVPKVHNDFIFSYVGQTCGFIGSVALVAVLAYICLKIVADSRIAKDSLGRNICVGVFGMMFAHCIMNIGMVLAVMPVIGVPLPFMSAGGTAVLSMYIAIGLVMSVYSHSEKNYRVFYDAN